MNIQIAFAFIMNAFLQFIKLKTIILLGQDTIELPKDKN